MTSLLDTGKLPIEDLASFALREGRRPRSYYQVHRWFARRFGAIFRSILVGAVTDQNADFWDSYYSNGLLNKITVFDPFMGGGTSIIEAKRLGANVIGVDIDPVACAISQFECDLISMPSDIAEKLKFLAENVGSKVSKYYQTETPTGDSRTVLHYFWVQLVQCPACNKTFEAHPHFQLAYEAEGEDQWVFCSDCHTIECLDQKIQKFTCNSCHKLTVIQNGTVRKGVAFCPYCGHFENLIDLYEITKSKPEWKLFALETIEPPLRKKLPMRQRVFRTATESDMELFNKAKLELQNRRNPDGTIQWIPDWDIPTEGRSDNRILKYGYKKYTDLFNPRQLLHLSLLAEEISKQDEPYKRIFSLAFSDHLTTNCMMTNYAFGWRRLAPLFSLRSYRHIPRPVELNPWMNGIGRGTFPNTVTQIQEAITAINASKEPNIKGGFRQLPFQENRFINQKTQVINNNSRSLPSIPDKSVDIILTDPPYFDNIAYSELSDFFLPWLVQFGIVPIEKERVFKSFGLDGNQKSKVSVADYEEMLVDCFSEAARVLKPDGIMAFTFQHAKYSAWLALATALFKSGLKSTQVLPLLGDSKAGLHKQSKTSSWDAVFVLRKGLCVPDNKYLTITKKQLESIKLFFDNWLDRLRVRDDIPFMKEDEQNFFHACLVAGSLGFLAEDVDENGEKYFLTDLLSNHQNLENKYAVFQ